MIKNVYWSPLFFPIVMKLEFSPQILENTDVFISLNIRLLGAELLHADRRTDRRNEADSRFPQFCKRA